MNVVSPAESEAHLICTGGDGSVQTYPLAGTEAAFPGFRLRRARQYWVLCAEAEDGVQVNHSPTEEALLSEGDEIRVGPVVYVFRSNTAVVRRPLLPAGRIAAWASIALLLIVIAFGTSRLRDKARDPAPAEMTPGTPIPGHAGRQPGDSPGTDEGDPIESARARFLVAADLYDHRHIRPGNLHLAMTHWRSVAAALEQMEPLPALHDAAKDRADAALQELQTEVAGLEKRAFAAERTGDLKLARTVLLEIQATVPDDTDPANRRATERLAVIADTKSPGKAAAKPAPNTNSKPNVKTQ